MPLLDWIASHNGESFFLGLFCLAALSWICHMIIRLVRGYPPPSESEAAMDQGGFCDCDCHTCDCDCESGLRMTAKRLSENGL